jgi:hypothetical protein
MANTYILGGAPELKLAFYDLDNKPMIPSEYRLSVKNPLGDILTVSGAELTTSVSGTYLTYIYRPPVIGWYEYEAWGKDGTGREIAQTNGFEVTDRVY